MQTISFPEGKKIYFASDNHLGAPSRIQSLPREKAFVAWLEQVRQDAAAIFLLARRISSNGVARDRARKKLITALINAAAASLRVKEESGAKRSDEEEQNENQRPAAARAFKFMCPNCDRLFPTRESKLRHVRLNACEEKLHCGYCFLVVYTRHALIKHENNHVKRGFSTDGFVPCAKCSRGFARDNWKEEHEATCKGISQQDLEAEGDKEERIIAQLKEAAAAEAEDSDASWPCLACDQVISQPTKRGFLIELWSLVCGLWL